jgi:hypothetical protein
MVKPDRAITQADLDAAARSFEDASVAGLRQLIDDFEGSEIFASRVICAAARQLLAARLRMGARDD